MTSTWWRGLADAARSENNDLTLQAGGTTTITGSGFKPGSQVSAWLSGESRLLGKAAAEADGSFTLTASVPSSLSGTDTLLLEGTNQAGARTGLAYGVTVAAAKSEVPFTGPGVGMALLFVALLAAAAGIAIRAREGLES